MRLKKITPFRNTLLREYATFDAGGIYIKKNIFYIADYHGNGFCVLKKISKNHFFENGFVMFIVKGQVEHPRWK